VGIIGDIKDVAKAVQQAGNLDLYKRILDLQGEALDLMEQLQEKNRTITELRQQLEKKRKVVYHLSVYYGAGEDGKPTTDGPYCPHCYDVSAILCHLQVYEGNGYCPECKQNFTVK